MIQVFDDLFNYVGEEDRITLHYLPDFIESTPSAEHMEVVEIKDKTIVLHSLNEGSSCRAFQVNYADHSRILREFSDNYATVFFANVWNHPYQLEINVMKDEGDNFLNICTFEDFRLMKELTKNTLNKYTIVTENHGEISFNVGKRGEGWNISLNDSKQTKGSVYSDNTRIVSDLYNVESEILSIGFNAKPKIKNVKSKK